MHFFFNNQISIKIFLELSPAQVHFRTELSSEKDLNEEYRTVIETLDQFYRDVNLQINDLDKALQQIDKYQQDIQSLKQKLVQEEQLLKTMAAEQSADNVQVRVCFFYIHSCFLYITIKCHKNLEKIYLSISGDREHSLNFISFSSLKLIFFILFCIKLNFGL